MTLSPPTTNTLPLAVMVRFSGLMGYADRVSHYRAMMQ
jgi:hypothetical protein